MLLSGRSDARSPAGIWRVVSGFRQARLVALLTTMSALVLLLFLAVPNRQGDKKPTLMSLREHIYTETDTPYFHETVPEYRLRLAKALRAVRPGTIFVSVASFRDDKCQNTLRRMYDKAKYPGRVFVGLVDQMQPWSEPLVVNDTRDIPCEARLTPAMRKNVRIVRLNARGGGQGPTHARYIASKLWDGEEVFMQVDAHADFVQDWDSLLMANLNAMPNPHKSVLSHYPTPESNQLGDTNKQWNCMSTHENAPPGLIYQVPEWCLDENMSEGIALKPNGQKTTCYTPFVGAGFMAGHASMLYDAPFDKYLRFLFHGEEPLIAARLWTSGWDLFTPAQNLVSHVYGARKHTVYGEVPNWPEYARKAEARARMLLGASLDADLEIELDLSEIDDLGMGTARSMEEYEEYAGVNWRTGVLISRCKMRYDGQRWIDINPPSPDAIQ